MKKLVVILVSLLVLAIVGVAIFLATFDADRYRPLLVTQLESALGKPVHLERLSLGWRGGIAKRIGLVNTMVFTHLPSSLLLLALPVVPTLSMAVVVFLVRESLVEMDVPTRQSYLVAVVDEQDRTRAVGVTNLTRSLAWAVAPVVSGSLMRSLSVSAPLVIGAGVKIAYDLLLYRAFRHLKPPEEREGSGVRLAASGML